jgi:hypothetical protein
MFVIPVPFNKYHKEMLSHCKELLEYRNGYVAINPKYRKLITALRTAVENGEGVLDKGAISRDDLFDAFKLSLRFWHWLLLLLLLLLLLPLLLRLLLNN